MKKLYNKYRHQRYEEQEYSMPVIARFGTGGGNMPIVLESNQDGVVVEALPFDTTQITSPMNYSRPKPNDPCHPLASTAHPPAVSIVKHFVGINGDIAGTLDAHYYKGAGERMGTEREVVAAINADSEIKESPVCVGNGQMCNITMKPIMNSLDCMHDQQAVLEREKRSGERMNSVVRRITPTECGRLQGFPDSWCDLGDWVDQRGKKHKDADTPKYKAYGNSLAVGFANNRSGFWCWLMRRISAKYERRPTQGSLFSGIGGFDLAWASVNGPESCRWSSEIEEFPIAVLKKHFGDEDAGIEGDYYQAINGG